ncbi:MAG: hypothetical protein ACD_65C00024G0001 [uncultured bacterium]|nr:MAG: hypothetical protein ACD_65C00024G0001 [uncultured bacterium]
MDRNPDSTTLRLYGTNYTLSYPPNRISGKFKTFLGIKLINGSEKTDIPFLYQIGERHTAIQIILGDTDDKSQIGFNKDLFGFPILFFNSSGQRQFVFSRQQRNTTYRPQVNTNGIPIITTCFRSFGHFEFVKNQNKS